jgi:hypothetical protein
MARALRDTPKIAEQRGTGREHHIANAVRHVWATTGD